MKVKTQREALARIVEDIRTLDREKIVLYKAPVRHAALKKDVITRLIIIGSNNTALLERAQKAVDALIVDAFISARAIVNGMYEELALAAKLHNRMDV